MKRIVFIGLAVIFMLISLLAVNCGNDSLESLEGNIKWTETTLPFSCTYDPPPTGYVNPDGDYKVAVGGQLENIANGKVSVFSAIFRLYNSADEVVGEKVFNLVESGEPRELVSNQHTNIGFEQNYTEEIVRYDVLVTDSDGNEYLCVRN